MKAPVSRLRRTLYVLAAVGVATALIGACSNGDRPDGAGPSASSSSGGTPQDLCGTPHEGCECLEPGAVVDCGEVKNVSSDGFVQCSMGTRQCLDGKWGKCFGETDVRTKSYMASGLTGTLALGAPAKCGSPEGGPADPCDPYCNAIVDNPVGLTPGGGLIVADGGLVVGVPDAGDGGAPAVFTSTAGGVVTCGGAVNITGPGCTPPGLATCQQDFRCNPSTNTCQWNGGPGYFDPAAGGADLTVGAPCGAGGAGTATAPVCNRGSVAVPAGSIIGFNISSTLPTGCTSLGGFAITNILAQPLAPGQCVEYPIGNAAGNKFITVNAMGSPGAVTEGPGLCANNSAPLKDDGMPGCGACQACQTDLTGKVFDPSGTANNLPLAGISVFQPSGTLVPFTDGVQCDSCASLTSTSTTAAVTDATGSFTLSNVTPGSNIPIVVQSGRWRRKITIPTINSCVTNTPADGTFRMPQNRTDGAGGQADIPKMAVSLGSVEALECLLLKIGISSSEIAPRTSAANPNRIQLYRDNGFMTTPAAASVTALYSGATPTLPEYAAVLFDCHSFSTDGANLWSTTNAQKDYFRQYADNGGRIFVDHWPGEVLIRNGATEFTNTATFTSNDNSKAPAGGKVLTPSAPHTTFKNWLTNVGASSDYGAGFVKVEQPRMQAIAPNGATTEQWIRGESTNSPGAWMANPGGDYSLSYSFDTPTGAMNNCGVAGGKGRVFFNGMHVSAARIKAPGTTTTTKTFPAGCDLSFGLTPEEKALEFQLFQLTACQIGGATPPPPPALPPALPVTYFTRDYQAVCGVGERVRWAPFYWEGVFAPGTSIDFRAATADTLAALPASPPAASPTTAAVGSGNTTVIAPAWDCNGCPGSPVTVDSQLIADTGTPSKQYLRIYMKFNPTATISPILTSWRQVYDCVPSE